MRVYPQWYKDLVVAEVKSVFGADISSNVAWTLDSFPDVDNLGKLLTSQSVAVDKLASFSFPACQFVNVSYMNEKTGSSEVSEFAMSPQAFVVLEGYLKSGSCSIADYELKHELLSLGMSYPQAEYESLLISQKLSSNGFKVVWSEVGKELEDDVDKKRYLVKEERPTGDLVVEQDGKPFLVTRDRAKKMKQVMSSVKLSEDVSPEVVAHIARVASDTNMSITEAIKDAKREFSLSEAQVEYCHRLFLSPTEKDSYYKSALLANAVPYIDMYASLPSLEACLNFIGNDVLDYYEKSGCMSCSFDDFVLASFRVPSKFADEMDKLLVANPAAESGEAELFDGDRKTRHVFRCPDGKFRAKFVGQISRGGFDSADGAWSWVNKLGMLLNKLATFWVREWEGYTFIFDATFDTPSKYFLVRVTSPDGRFIDDPKVGQFVKLDGEGGAFEAAKAFAKGHFLGEGSKSAKLEIGSWYEDMSIGQNLKVLELQEDGIVVQDEAGNMSKVSLSHESSFKKIGVSDDIVKNVLDAYLTNGKPNRFYLHVYKDKKEAQAEVDLLNNKGIVSQLRTVIDDRTNKVSDYGVLVTMSWGQYLKLRKLGKTAADESVSDADVATCTGRYKLSEAVCRNLLSKGLISLKHVQGENYNTFDRKVESFKDGEKVIYKGAPATVVGAGEGPIFGNQLLIKLDSGEEKHVYDAELTKVSSVKTAAPEDEDTPEEDMSGVKDKPEKPEKPEKVEKPEAPKVEKLVPETPAVSPVDPSSADNDKVTKGKIKSLREDVTIDKKEIALRNNWSGNWYSLELYTTKECTSEEALLLLSGLLGGLDQFKAIKPVPTHRGWNFTLFVDAANVANFLNVAKPEVVGAIEHFIVGDTVLPVALDASFKAAPEAERKLIVTNSKIVEVKPGKPYLYKIRGIDRWYKDSDLVLISHMGHKVGAVKEMWDAYFIKPDGSIITIGQKQHEKFIRENPELFNELLSKEELAKINALSGVDRDTAWEDMILVALKCSDWIRVIGSGPEIAFEGHKLDSDLYKRIDKFIDEKHITFGNSITIEVGKNYVNFPYDDWVEAHDSVERVLRTHKMAELVSDSYAVHIPSASISLSVSAVSPQQALVIACLKHMADNPSVIFHKSNSDALMPYDASMKGALLTELLHDFNQNLPTVSIVKEAVKPVVIVIVKAREEGSPGAWVTATEKIKELLVSGSELWLKDSEGNLYLSSDLYDKTINVGGVSYVYPKDNWVVK